MSKLEISADSDTKDCTVSLDGKAIDGIRNGYFSFGYAHDGDKQLNLEISRTSVDPTTKLSKNERLTWTPAGMKGTDYREIMRKI